MYKVVIKKGEEWWKLLFTYRYEAENVADMVAWLGADEVEVCRDEDYLE